MGSEVLGLVFSGLECECYGASIWVCINGVSRPIGGPGDPWISYVSERYISFYTIKGMIRLNVM